MVVTSRTSPTGYWTPSTKYSKQPLRDFIFISSYSTYRTQKRVWWSHWSGSENPLEEALKWSSSSQPSGVAQGSGSAHRPWLRSSERLYGIRVGPWGKGLGYGPWGPVDISVQKFL